MPSGTPAAMERATATATRLKVSAAAAHMPTTPMYNMPSTQNTAIRRPANVWASQATRRINTGQGIQSSRSLTGFRP